MLLLLLLLRLPLPVLFPLPGLLSERNRHSGDFPSSLSSGRQPGRRASSVRSASARSAVRLAARCRSARLDSASEVQQRKNSECVCKIDAKKQTPLSKEMDRLRPSV